MTPVANALRLIRVFHDLSQTELADELELSKSFISEIESGAKTPTIDLLNKYSEHFDIPVSSLMFFSEAVESGNTKVSDKIRGQVSNKIIALLEWLASKEKG